MVIPTTHNGSGAICEIKRTTDPKTKQTRLHFFFQQKKYIYNDESKLFEKLDYPSHHRYTIEDYKKWTGLPTEEDVTAAKNKYGGNK